MAATAAPWSRSDRSALVAVAVQFAANGALFASFVPRLPEIRHEASIGLDQLGVLLSVGNATGLVASALVSRQIVRFGTRRVLVIYMAVCSIALSIVGVATIWPLVLLGLAGLALADVFVDVAMNMQASWLSARRRRPVMNRLHGLWSLGTVVGGAVASWAAEAGVSLRVHLIVAAVVLLLLATVLSTRLLHVDEQHEPAAPAVVDAKGVRGRRRRTGMGRADLLFAGFFAVVIEATAIGWAAFRLTDDFGATAAVGALAYVAVTAGMMTGRFSGDTIAHRIGSTRLLRLSTLVAGAGLALASLVPSLLASLAGFALAGLGAATMIPKLYDDAAKMPGRAGAGLGALTAGVRAASLGVPAAVGVLGDSSLSVGSAIALVSVPAAAAFLVATRRLSPTI